MHIPTLALRPCLKSNKCQEDFPHPIWELRENRQGICLPLSELTLQIEDLETVGDEVCQCFTEIYPRHHCALSPVPGTAVTKGRCGYFLRTGCSQASRDNNNEIHKAIRTCLNAMFPHAKKKRKNLFSYLSTQTL